MVGTAFAPSCCVVQMSTGHEAVPVAEEQASTEHSQLERLVAQENSAKWLLMLKMEGPASICL